MPRQLRHEGTRAWFVWLRWYSNQGNGPAHPLHRQAPEAHGIYTTAGDASHWEWDADGVKGTAARMEQLCLHALLVQLYVPDLVSEGELPDHPAGRWQRGFWRPLSPLGDPLAPPLEWVEPRCWLWGDPGEPPWCHHPCHPPLSSSPPRTLRPCSCT